jgi:hypothetical protein
MFWEIKSVFKNRLAYADSAYIIQDIQYSVIQHNDTQNVNKTLNANHEYNNPQ